MWNEIQVSLPSKVPLSGQIDDLASVVNRLSNEDYSQLLSKLRRSLIAPADRSPHFSIDTDTTAMKLLTNREADVLTLVASGYSRKEIGESLTISENTAASHIASIYRKMGISTIAEATHIAISHGVIELKS